MAGSRFQVPKRGRAVKTAPETQAAVWAHQPSPRNIPANAGTIYSKLVKEVVINRFHFKMQLLSATRQNSGEFIFQ